MRIWAEPYRLGFFCCLSATVLLIILSLKLWNFDVCVCVYVDIWKPLIF